MKYKYWYMFDKARILAVILVSLIVSGAFMLLPETSDLLSDAEYNALHGFATGASGSSFTNVSLDGAMHDGGPITMSRMSNSRNSLFRHRRVAVESSAQQQHYAAPNISYSLSAGNANASFGAMSNGASSSMVANASTSTSMPIYTTSGASSAKGRVHSTDANSVSWASPQTSALAMSSVYSSHSSVYAGSMASGYQTVANGSVFGNFGGKGPMRAAPNLGQTELGGFFDWLIAQGHILYGGQAPDKYGDDPEQLFWWFSQSEIEDWFQKYLEACQAAGVTPQFNDWKDLMSWFNSEGNTQYRFPLPDGTIFLLVLLVGYSLFLYFRSRKRNDIVE